MCLYRRLFWPGGTHVFRFRATWVVFTDTSYVTHSKDKDGWEIGGIFALIFSSSLYCNLWWWRGSHNPRVPVLSLACLLYQGLCLISTSQYQWSWQSSSLPRVFTFSLWGSPAPCCLSQYSCGYQWVLWQGWYVGSDPIRRLETLSEYNYHPLEILQKGHYGNMHSLDPSWITKPQQVEWNYQIFCSFAVWTIFWESSYL